MKNFIALWFRNSASLLLELSQRHITLSAPEVILEVDPTDRMKRIQNLCSVLRKAFVMLTFTLMPFISGSLWDFWCVLDMKFHWRHNHEATEKETAMEYKEV